jgi:hypothetical protein
MSVADQPPRFTVGLKRQIQEHYEAIQTVEGFMDWSRTQGIDNSEPSMEQGNFRRFQKECEESSQRHSNLVDQLFLLYKEPLPRTDFGQPLDNYSTEGWNTCLITAVLKGEIPQLDERDFSEVPKQAIRNGWNDAVLELKRKHADLFKGINAIHKEER